ncbi:MAG: 8-amino-7-oxononanoate synthase [Deltaproteobacteria bacterium]|nr:8-amino-7-oxononanoate synthase [Deltaproteobacteria bacterium]TLN04578.1 MAG: 8-amino-7-oxononanoate synthase [bacterium]
MSRIEGSQGARVVLDGKEVLLLCSNNYLGLVDHPALKEAAIKAVEKYGVGTGASRLVSGTMALHEQLEEQIATFKGTERAMLFNSGYAANTGVIPALAQKGDILFSDKLNHASIVDGCLLSRARMVRYPHNDMAFLRRCLENSRGEGRRIIIADGVFSMDGDLAKLAELVSLKKEFGALLMVDDAHGTGVLGLTGRGTAEYFGLSAEIDITMGTLGKALGGFGAFIASTNEIVDYLVNRARSFIFSTSLPPAVLAAASAAIEIVDSREGAELRQRLAENSLYLRTALSSAGFDTLGSDTQIVPVFVGEAHRTMEFSRALLEEGIFVQGIRPPTVPVGSSRLRCTLMATHRLADLQQVVAAICRTRDRLGILPETTGAGQESGPRNEAL